MQTIKLTTIILIANSILSVGNNKNDLTASQIRAKMNTSIMSQIMDHNNPEQIIFQSSRIDNTNQQNKLKAMGTIKNIVQNSNANVTEQEIRQEMGLGSQVETFYFAGIVFTQLNAADCKNVAALIQFEREEQLESEQIPLDFTGHYDNYMKIDCDELKSYLAKGVEIKFLGKNFRTGLNKQAPTNEMGQWKYTNRDQVMVTAQRVQLEGLGHLKGVLKDGSAIGAQSSLKRLCVELSMSNENNLGDNTGRNLFMLI